MKIKLIIPDERIVELIDHIDYNVGYSWWIDDETVKLPQTVDEMLKGQFELRADPAETGKFSLLSLLNYSSFKNGLELMAANSPNRFRDIVENNMDAVTCDVFMQYVVFRKEVYG